MFVFYSVKNPNTMKRDLIGISTGVDNMQVRQAAQVSQGTVAADCVPIPEPITQPEGTDAWVYIPDEYGQFYTLAPDNNKLYNTITTRNTGYICRLPLVAYNITISAGNYTVGSFPLALEIGVHGIRIYDRAAHERFVEIGSCAYNEGVVKFEPNTGLWSHYDDGQGNAGTMDKVLMFSYGKKPNGEYGVMLVSGGLEDPAWHVKNGAWTRGSGSSSPVRIWAVMRANAPLWVDKVPENGSTRFAQTAYLTKRGLEQVRTVLPDIDSKKRSDGSFVVR